MADRDAKLEGAGRVKEEGNVLYKTGKFDDARKCYNQVLDLLTTQTSLTNGKKEKRDNLVVTAHLNLAACELKLGDNAKVIQHCSLALQMDQKRIKAYHRRGQAYHNNKDYDLALKDYLEAERLDPQNAEVRKQKEKLLADTMEACGRVADQETLDGASDEYYHEMVVLYGGEEEADPQASAKKCRKAARHNEFIPVSQFCLDHLPEQYRTDTMLAFMEALIDSTVRLAVGYSSEDRPVGYPFSEKKYRRAVRTGSGFVQGVNIYPEDGNKVCPCGECQSSGKPKTQFAQIEIHTAEHVVYDLSEARKTNCYFYFHDQKDRRSCPRLSGGVDVEKSGGDYFTVYFVTHDLKLADNVKETYRTLYHLCHQLKSDMGIITGDEEEEKMKLSEKFSNLQEKFQETIQKHRQDIDRLKTITKDNADQLLVELVQKQGQGGDSMYGKILRDKLEGGGMCDMAVSKLSSSYESMIAYNDKLQYIKDNFKATLDQHGYPFMLESYTLYREALRIRNRLLRWIWDVPGNGAATSTSEEDKFYDSSHPFTVIVSHPHGLGKKISLGNVKERTGLGYSQSSYQYTNTTCPGSSGAPVFIMGRLGLRVCYPHSKMVQLQINQSGISLDW